MQMTHNQATGIEHWRTRASPLSAAFGPGGDFPVEGSGSFLPAGELGGAVVVGYLFDVPARVVDGVDVFGCFGRQIPAGHVYVKVIGYVLLHLHNGEITLNPRA